MGSDPLRLITLRYTGLFDFDGLYAAIIDWAKNYGYMWHEKDYKHKVPSPSGAEQEWMWEMTKNVTDYIGHKIIFTVHSWDITEIQVDVEGKKKDLTNARLYIKIQPTLIYDWQKRFKGRFGSKLGGWYQKVWRKDYESTYGDQLYYRVWDLHAIIKKYFDMQTKKYAYKGYLGET
ncbi:hypothetical protein HOL21_04860 [Candidatus Woesearchaeota archaeon]|jgi:hypothetical protein|nr:hypothetical protein [Candidatus Woesearchaeota archaeon]MBT5397517.1 hypothetical protein [Candidatus Woesearchaeota archaeon]MBT5924944.1 hypothetical protein [Candidatus Woesearchaeota archaeon]MBT6367910.1 hypothetical protein [Candidatus Woesearchaeota archaeon]MBT7763134.1 hypothetical protein [Candidatus Woesearchaeota archaeon]